MAKRARLEKYPQIDLQKVRVGASHCRLLGRIRRSNVMEEANSLRRRFELQAVIADRPKHVTVSRPRSHNRSKRSGNAKNLISSSSAKVWPLGPEPSPPEYDGTDPRSH
jgi:hypothetical protein